MHHEIVGLARNMSIALRDPNREHLLGAYSRQALRTLTNLMADELCDLAEEVKREAPAASVPTEIELIYIAIDVVRHEDTDPGIAAMIGNLSPTTDLCVRLSGIARDALAP